MEHKDLNHRDAFFVEQRLRAVVCNFRYLIGIIEYRLPAEDGAVKSAVAVKKDLAQLCSSLGIDWEAFYREV